MGKRIDLRRSLRSPKKKLEKGQKMTEIKSERLQREVEARAVSLMGTSDLRLSRSTKGNQGFLSYVVPYVHLYGTSSCLESESHNLLCLSHDMVIHFGGFLDALRIGRYRSELSAARTLSARNDIAYSVPGPRCNVEGWRCRR